MAINNANFKNYIDIIRPKGRQAQSVRKPRSTSSRWRLSSVSVAWSDQEYIFFPLDVILVHRRVTHTIEFTGNYLNA